MTIGPHWLLLPPTAHLTDLSSPSRKAADLDSEENEDTGASEIELIQVGPNGPEIASLLPWGKKPNGWCVPG